jgi:hypothetical protein
MPTSPHRPAVVHDAGGEGVASGVLAVTRSALAGIAFAGPAFVYLLLVY